MGWTFSKEWQTEGQAFEASVRELDRSICTVLDTTLRGGEGWILVRDDRGPHKGRIVALLTLIEKQGGRYGVKEMTEDEHPCYYNIPLGWLGRLSAPQSDYSRQWRENVKAYHREKAETKKKGAAWKAGDRVTLPHIPDSVFVLERSSGGCWYAHEEQTGRFVKLVRHNVARMVLAGNQEAAA